MYPDAFARSLRVLEGDRDRTRAPIFVTFAALLAWGAWLGFARIAVYASSGDAVIEASALPHVISPAVDGIVESSRLQLGHRVEKGEALIVLDARPELLKMAETAARRDALLANIAALEAQQEREKDAAVSALARAEETIRVANVKHASSASLAALTKERDGVIKALRERELASTLDTLASAVELGRETAAAEVQGADLQRTVTETRLDLADRAVRVAAVARDLADVRGQVAVQTATLQSLEYACALKELKAPAGGVVASVVELAPGATVRANQVLASIVPEGPRRAIANFAASEAVGRITPGQPARLRLDGFPWTQYGTVDGTVKSVGLEAIDGKVRVEIEVKRDNRRIPLEHGLRGTAEVVVETASPLEVLLRSIGQTRNVAPVSEAAPPASVRAR